MHKKMNFKTHKDNSPQNTVKEIRDILSDLGIFLNESEWFSFTDNCFSVHLADMKLPNYYSNGKGVSKNYALASAYAEYIERLQGNFLVSKEFGLMQNNSFGYHDVTETTLGSFAENNKTLIEHLIDTKTVKKYKDLKINCFPYYEVTKGKIKSLPFFIPTICSANGLCAGNTPEEALCQGICEIFERFVVKEIYFNNNLELPTIPLSALKGLEIYSMIDAIINEGYEIIIKDSTLNGKLPVICVIILDKNKNSYLYSFASDMIFEVAIQRCLTELFQGIDKKTIYKENKWIKLDFSSKQFSNKRFLSKEDNIKLEYIKTFLRSSGELPNNVFTSCNESKNFENAFQNTFKNHRDSLKFLTNIIKKNKFSMYIRDMSNLGFQTFRVFIPELSVVKKINNKKMKILYVERSFIKKVLLKLKKTSTKDIEKCANLLEPLLSTPEDYYSWKYFSKGYLNLIIDESSHFKQFDHLVFLLGMLFFRIGNFEKSFKYLDIFIKEEGYKIENIDYYSTVLLYLKLKSNKYSDNEIKITLRNTFGENLSKRVINNLSNTEECFKYFILPECGDCTNCPINNECKYDIWSKINTKIIQKMNNNPIKQENISNIFKKIN